MPPPSRSNVIKYLPLCNSGLSSTQPRYSSVKNKLHFPKIHADATVSRDEAKKFIKQNPFFLSNSPECVSFSLSLSLSHAPRFVPKSAPRGHWRKSTQPNTVEQKVTRPTRCKEYAPNDTSRSIARHRLNRATTGKRTLKRRHSYSPSTSSPIYIRNA